MNQIASESLRRVWGDDLADHSLIHADAAGCSARSRRVVQAVKSHLDLESEQGAYAAEEQSADAIHAARIRLASMTGVPNARVHFTQNATQAFRWLVNAYGLRRGARIGILPSDYPSNRAALQSAAVRHELELVTLATDALGRLELDSLGATVETLDLVTFPHIPSHRGVVQPVQEAGALCRRSGVPLILDVAQSLGQLDLVPVAADGYVGTSRKWLQGPRGVGFAIIGGLSVRTDNLCGPEDGDQAIAERVGLSVALERVAEVGMDALHNSIFGLAKTLREAISDGTGWRVVEPVEEPSGTTTIKHPSLDPLETNRLLRKRGIVGSVVPVERAPDEMREPLLRLSLHAYCDEASIGSIVEALREKRTWR